MADSKPRTANWEPGTLDKTRKAIGNIDREEAAKMTKLLGGEIMYEKSNNTMSSPKGAISRGAIVRASKDKSENPSKDNGTTSSQKENQSTQSAKTTQTVQKPVQMTVVQKGRGSKENLIEIPTKANTLMDKVMMSSEFGIKPNYGFFNFLKHFQQNGHEIVNSDFCKFAMKMQVENLQDFVNAIKTIVQLSPSTYKAKIEKSSEPKFKFLRSVSEWQIQQVRATYVDLLNLSAPYTVADLIPYTRQMFRLVIQIYYFGEANISKLIKEIFVDECSYPDAKREKMSQLSRQAVGQWVYIQSEIIKRMYPLLMRMCSTTFEYYPDFYRTRVSEILKFVGLHKYDLLLQEKQKEKVVVGEKNSESSAEGETEGEETKKPETPIRGEKDSYVTAGIELLEQMFPQAGFDALETHPDMYPYFQPLYKFEDGFNVLNPENSLQVVVVLMRIVEDFFKGCRNIAFVPPTDAEIKEKRDTINDIFSDWTTYRETVFEKLYCEPLNELVNQLYSQTDFAMTQFGKKIITSLWWQTNYHFLPNFKFDRLLLERPADESKVPPLYKRTDFARKYLKSVVEQCDLMAKSKGTVAVVRNPWEPYKFDVPNEVSRRVDVLLGAKNKGPNTNATNANLLKYTLCVVSVLDWWINHPESPAYNTSPKNIYRISAEDGKPQFSTKVRSDQNKLFTEKIRAAYKNKAAEEKA